MTRAQAVVGQSGGPTSVINSSLVGIVETARRSSRIGRVYGMRFGIEGFMEDQLVDLSARPKTFLQGLRRTPSSALGSSRHKTRDEDLPRILELLKKHDIRYFFLIGGNDTMDTIHRVEAFCRREGYELAGVGIPKTVDNDLFGTDHTPGFPSAARCNILNVQQAGLLARDMQRVDKFVIYQSVGRDAGWLAASAAAARRREADAPHLIYLPERPFDRERFLVDVQECLRRFGWVSVVCGEGLKQADGNLVSASQVRDKFGNVEFGAMGGASVALTLHGLLKERLGLRGEFQITESLIMCAMDRAVELDLEEAYGCGREAVRLAEAGRSGVMIALQRQPGSSYRVLFATAALEEVAAKSKPMPPEYINPEGNFVTEAFLQYIRPLVGPIPEYTSL
jgi:6-phosphofructokinase 1